MSIESPLFLDPQSHYGGEGRGDGVSLNQLLTNFKKNVGPQNIWMRCRFKQKQATLE